MPERILEVKNLVTQFSTDSGLVNAVNNVSFNVYRGQTLGIVGESGSGKSVTALSVMGLIANPPGKIIGGEINYLGKNLLELSNQEMRQIRGNKISMIFQEPMTSLNPVMTVGQQIIESLCTHNPMMYKDALSRGIELLNLVGIPAPEKRIHEYPHQLSGGMRQRIMIAMALSMNPDILIADEPTTALDVTIQAQILDLMVKLQEEMGMGVIMITHDLGVVAETCHDVAVMYCGQIVEQADVQTLFASPKHPYTKGLMESIPPITPVAGRNRRLKTIPGIVPSLLKLPAGCSFQDRCNLVQEDCKVLKPNHLSWPELSQVTEEHLVRCLHPLENSLSSF